MVREFNASLRHWAKANPHVLSGISVGIRTRIPLLKGKRFMNEVVKKKRLAKPVRYELHTLLVASLKAKARAEDL